MHYRRFVLFVFAFLIISFVGSAQDVITVDKLTLDQHVERRYGPIYPPIAQAAHVMGTVVIEVRVGLTGKVESLKVVSGPPMLQGAAIECLKYWTYYPFVKDGKPIAVTGLVSIGFGIQQDELPRGEKKIADRYFKLADQCKKSNSSGADAAEAATICKQAADTADEFAPDVRFIEKRSAFVAAATAFVANNDLKTALTYAAKAVDVAKLGHDDNSGSVAAFWVKSVIEAKLHDLTAADQDLTIAEDFERKKIVWAEQVGFEPSDGYKRAFAQNLRFHAMVLQGLNRQDEAKKMLDEASKYN